MSAKSWEAAMADSVREIMSVGATFDFAWSCALKRHRPSMRDQRRVAPFREALTLFEDAELAEPSVVECTRQYFEDAVFGRRPGLRNFSLDLLAGSVDETSSRAVNDEFRMAA